MKRFLAAAALFAFAQLPPAAQETSAGLYVSDDRGVPYERIEPFRADEFPYVLSVERSPEREIRALKSGKTEVKRWELYFESGKLVSTRSYEGEALVEESAYESGRLRRTRAYSLDGSVLNYAFSYDGARLASVTVTDGAGKPLRVDYVSYARSGFAYAVKRVFPDGRIELDGEFRTASGSESWRNSDGTQLALRRDESGNVVFEERFSGGVSVERSVIEYAGKRIARKSTEYPKDGTRVLFEYDERGRVSVETTRDALAVLSAKYYLYDDEGRTESLRTVSGNAVTLVEYEYRDDGSLLSERQSEDGVLAKVIAYGEGDERTEELYDGGVLFARIRYVGERKKSEEIIVDGVTVRQRSYP